MDKRAKQNKEVKRPNLRTCLGRKNARVDALAVKAEDPKAIGHVEFVPFSFSVVCVRTEGVDA